MEGGLRVRGAYKRSIPGRPLISVVLPVKNCVSSFEKSLLSVLGQTYDNVELIVIDGASADGTLDLLKQYDPRIDFWISETDGGIYDAMNKGVKFAMGDWLYFFGADDCMQDVLHRIAPHLTDPRCVYYANVQMPGREKGYDGRFFLTKLMRRNICHQAIFYPKAVFKKYTFNLLYPLMADYDLNLTCWGDRDVRFRYLPFSVASYSNRGQSYQRRDLAFERDKKRLLLRVLWNRMKLF